MLKSFPPYFALSEDFSYPEYLEQRSHFDIIELSIDRQTAALVGGLNRISELAVPDGATANALEELKDAITSSFSEANESLREISINTASIAQDTLHIRMGVNELIRETRNTSALMEWGFSATLKELLAANEKLDRIINALENQDQTWAYSQYKIAYRLLHEEGLNSEALDYATRAIEGHNGNAGYPLDSNFFLLRGAIRLGVTENIEIEIIDVEKAIVDFSLAARYSRKKKDETHIVSLSFLGQAYYCQANLKEAIECLTKAAELDPANGHINFNLAKALICHGEKHKAMQVFRISLREDWMFAHRASSDQDFARVADLRLREIEGYRQELLDQLSPLCEFADLDSVPVALRYVGEKRLAAEGVSKQTQQALLSLRDLCDSRRSATIEELASVTKNISYSILRALSICITSERARWKASALRHIPTPPKPSINEPGTTAKHENERRVHKKSFESSYLKVILGGIALIGIVEFLIGHGLFGFARWIALSTIWIFGAGIAYAGLEEVFWQKKLIKLKERAEVNAKRLAATSRSKTDHHIRIDKMLKPFDETLQGLDNLLRNLEKRNDGGH